MPKVVKPTMTDYRADLLESLPIDRSRIKEPKIFQLADCVKLGWAEHKSDGLTYITGAGRTALQAYRPAR